MSRSRRVKKILAKDLLALLQPELEKFIKAEFDKRENRQTGHSLSQNTAALSKSHRIYATKYKHIFCEMILKNAEEGRNLREFAAKIEVSTRTILDWAKKYPEFNYALEVAKTKQEAYWWDLARKHMNEKFCYNLFLFVMVNLCGYRNPDMHINFIEKQEPDNGVVILPEVKTIDEILEEEEDERTAENEIEQSSISRSRTGVEPAENGREHGCYLETAENSEETA
ncbi:MAG: hypothetical protein ACM34K_12660 [Bacillota bacterium]